MSKTIFKVGMKVYDEVNFPGRECIVISVDSHICFPILVKDINSDTERSYTYDGRLYKGSTPTLSTTPYTVDFKGFSQEEPLKKGQIVWVKDDENDEWVIGHFIGMSSNEEPKYRVSSTPNHSGANFKFLTTKNPYENIE